MFVRVLFFFFFKQKTAYEMRISDWSSDVCSSDLQRATARAIRRSAPETGHGFLREPGLPHPRRPGCCASGQARQGDRQRRWTRDKSSRAKRAQEYKALAPVFTWHRAKGLHDRTSVVTGKSGTVVGDQGGSRS